MGIEAVFDGIIYLPKSKYIITLRVTFWQAFFDLLSILFMSVDVVINDVIERIVEKISRSFWQKIESIAGGIARVSCPRVACA